MKFYVNEDCIGCGLCASTCSEVYSMKDDNVAVAISTEIDASLVSSATEAMENCPVSAIEQK